MIDFNQPIPFDTLLSSDAAALKKAGLKTLCDVILATPDELAKKHWIPPLEMRRAVENALNTAPTYNITRLDALGAGEGQFRPIFSTGDPILDEALGGGVRTEHLTEIAGQSAAGKTGLALQLSLFVQLPKDQGGASGSTCYLTTKSRLETRRLLQILSTNERLAEATCSLEDVHTMTIPTVHALHHSLEHVVPGFIGSIKTKPGRKPVKLLVIDALAELFHDRGTTSSSFLIERAKDISKISSHLHQLANRYGIAVIVLNEVVDALDRSEEEDLPNPFTYNTQSRLFASMDGLAGERRREAALGLSWANQVNTRIMLSRKGRRRHAHEDERLVKRPRLGEESDAGQTQSPGGTSTPIGQDTMLIRRLSILFSSVCSPASFDYIVTERGISLLPPGDRPLQLVQGTPTQNIPLPTGPQPSTIQHLAPIDVGAFPVFHDPLPKPPSSDIDLEVIPSSQGEEEDLLDLDGGEPQGVNLGDTNWDEIEFNLTQFAPS